MKSGEPHLHNLRDVTQPHFVLGGHQRGQVPIPAMPQEGAIERTLCSCGLIPRTRLKAVLSAKGVL